MSNRHFRVPAFLAAVILASAFSWGSPQQEEKSAKKDFVYLLNADEIRYSQRINPDAQILVGNVVFRHDSMYMYCDSALFFQNANSFNAYNDIRVEQGDTLFMYGDSLYYDGNTRMCRVRYNVRLENRDMILLTDSLNFDRNRDLGYFFEGGMLLDFENTLTSDYGQYSTQTGTATFIRDVVLESPDYIMKTDTLNYNVDSHIAYLTSPTEITSDDNVINTSRGMLNTDTRNSVLLDRSVIVREEGKQTMTGDSIVYNDDKGLAWGYGNVVINDLKDHVDILADYVFVDQERDSALFTGNAQAIEYSSGDSLFIHADTFKLRTIVDANDSVINRQMKAYYKVKAWRTDLQMVADSMEFETKDSCLTMYRDPIVWSGSQQVLGEVIKAYLNDSTLDWVHIIGQALYVQREDSTYYDQIAGREMKAYFKNGNISSAYVNGNVMVVYFPLDEDSTMIGMNTTESSNLTAYFENRDITKIVIHEKSSGVMYPMDQIPPEKMHLSQFAWFDNLRPFSRYDIFYWRGKKASEKLKDSPSRDVPLPTLRGKK